MPARKWQGKTVCTAKLIPADVKSILIRFAGIVEGEQIGHAGCRERTFKLLTEHISAYRMDTQKALFLAEQELVHIQLGAD